MIVQDVRLFTQLAIQELHIAHKFPNYRLGAVLFNLIADPQNLIREKAISASRWIVENPPATNETIRKITSLWTGFTHAFLQKDLAQVEQAFFNLAKGIRLQDTLDAFSVTDLIVVNDGLSLKLPNVVTNTEFTAIKQLYDHFMSKIVIEVLSPPGNDPMEFAKIVVTDILLLLSRPTGRLLIQKVSEKLPGKLYITFHHDFRYKHSPDPRICYSLADCYYYYLTEKGIINAKAPTFSQLGHELIHCLHYLEDEGDHSVNPRLAASFDSNEEEVRTIYGMQCCERHGETAISENQILKEFGFPPRLFHLGSAHRDPELLAIRSILANERRGTKRSRSAPPA